MRRAKKSLRHNGEALSAADVSLIERLVADGMLIAKPQQPNAKLRKVIAAALEPQGKRIILWLSTKTTSLGDA